MTIEAKPARSFLADVDYTTSPVEDALNSVCHPNFKPTAAAFLANIKNAESLLQLPHSLLMLAHVETQKLLVFTDVYLPVFYKGGRYEDIDTRKIVDEEFAKRMDQLRTSQDFKDELITASDSRMAQLLEGGDMQKKIRMVLLSLVSATWTAFEVLAGDAWRFALNNRPDLTAQRVLQQLFPHTTAEGLSAKGIPVWLAAQYGFDLRSHIGDILKSRIDFSDIGEIRKAYRAAFGEIAELEKHLGDRRLLILESTRHVIVHRGGTVDEKYNHLTNKNFEIGRPLPLEPTFLSDALRAGIAAGCAINIESGGTPGNPTSFRR